MPMQEQTTISDALEDKLSTAQTRLHVLKHIIINTIKTCTEQAQNESYSTIDDAMDQF